MIYIIYILLVLYYIHYIVLHLTHQSPAIKRMKPSEAKKMKKRYLNAIEDTSKQQPTSSLAPTTSGISNNGNTHTLPSSAVDPPLAQGDGLLQRHPPQHPPNHNPTTSSSSSTNNTTTDCNRMNNSSHYDFDKYDSINDQSDEDGEEVDDEALFDRLINYHFIANKNPHSSSLHGDVDDDEGHNSDHEELTEEGDSDDGTLRSGDQEIEVIDLTSDAGTVHTLSSGSKMSKRSNSDTLVESVADCVSLSVAKNGGDVHKKQKTDHHHDLDEQEQGHGQGPSDDYGNTFEPMLSYDVDIDVGAGASATQTNPAAAASDLVLPITTLQRDESTGSKRALNGNNKPDSGRTSASSTPPLAHNGNGNGSSAHTHTSHTSTVPKTKGLLLNLDSLLSIPLPVIIQVHVKRSDVPCHLGGYMTSFKPPVYITQIQLCLQHLQLLQSYYTSTNNNNNKIHNSTAIQESQNINKLTHILQNIKQSKQLAEVANIPHVSGSGPPPANADVYGVGILQHSGLIYGNTTTTNISNNNNSSNSYSSNSKHYGEKFISINNIELYNKNIKYLEKTFHTQCIQLLDSTTPNPMSTIISTPTPAATTTPTTVSTPITAASMQVSEPYLTIELIRLPEYVYDDIDMNPIHILIKQLVSSYHSTSTDTTVAVTASSSSSNGTSNIHSSVKSTPPIVTPIAVADEEEGQNYDHDSFELPLPKRMSTSPVGSANASYASIESTSSQHTAASSTASGAGGGRKRKSTTSTTSTKKPDKKPKPEVKPQIKIEKDTNVSKSPAETHADRRERLMSSLYEGCSLFIRVSASAKEPYAAKVLEVYPDSKQIRVRWESRGDEEVVKVDPDTMEHFDSLQPRSRRGN